VTALPWKDEYRVNVSVIDDQHRKLAELARRLHDALEQGRPAGEIFLALNELIAFTRRHFATEEELMVKYRYPDLAAHRAAHRELLARLQALAGFLRDRVSVGFAEKGDIGNDWVTRHLLERDLKLGRYLNAKGVY
jgi:hemerythrin